jgi:hypothetical protein
MYENYIVAMPNTDYILENIRKIISSVIEWHCNITEYSYANHDNYPPLHKHDELLHIRIADNKFCENPVYKEIPKKIVYPLKGRFCG